jgi:hypothetical protein
MHNIVVSLTRQSSLPSCVIPCAHKHGSGDRVTAIYLFNQEMPSQNMPVQRQKGAILPPDLPCCGPITRLGEILATGKSHKNKPDGSFPKED